MVITIPVKGTEGSQMTAHWVVGLGTAAWMFMTTADAGLVWKMHITIYTL